MQREDFKAGAYATIWLQLPGYKIKRHAHFCHRSEIVFTARCTHVHSAVLLWCLSVRPFVCLSAAVRYPGLIGWVSSRIISLASSLFEASNIVLIQREISANYGRVAVQSRKVQYLWNGARQRERATIAAAYYYNSYTSYQLLAKLTTSKTSVLNVLVFYFSLWDWFLPLFGMCVWHVFIKLLTYLLTYLSVIQSCL